MSNTPFLLGADLNNPDAWNSANQALFQTTYNSFTALMGSVPQFIDSSVDYNQPISGWIGSASEQAQSQARSASAKSMTPVIAMPMFSNASGSGTVDQQLKAFASGQYDSVIEGIVQSYTQQGYHTLDFRLGWEMNIAGTPTYVGASAQNQADWVAAFQHMSTVLHQAASANGATAQVIWNPGSTNYSDASATYSLYPGNNYVDIIGADIYGDMAPYTDANGLYHDWATGGEDSSIAQFMANPVNRQHYWTYPSANMWTNDASSGHSQTFLSLLQFAEQQGKPFAIPETGAGNSNNGGDVIDDPTFPQWLSAQLTAAQSVGQKIAFVNLWDTNAGGNYEFSNASDGKPQEAAAWAKYFGAAQTSSAPSSPPSTPTGSTTYNPGAAGGTITTIGADTVNVGTGAVTVDANGPSVNVVGGAGRLTFIGKSGTDKVTASTGDVVVNGNADNLTFTAGTGYSTINAGSGHEIFNIINGHAGNWLKIADFVPGLDSIHLSGYSGTGIATNGTSGGTTYITLTDHTTIALVGVTPSTSQIFS